MMFRISTEKSKKATNYTHRPIEHLSSFFYNVKVHSAEEVCRLEAFVAEESSSNQYRQ